MKTLYAELSIKLKGTDPAIPGDRITFYGEGARERAITEAEKYSTEDYPTEDYLIVIITAERIK